MKENPKQTDRSEPKPKSFTDRKESVVASCWILAGTFLGFVVGGTIGGNDGVENNVAIYAVIGITLGGCLSLVVMPKPYRSFALCLLPIVWLPMCLPLIVRYVKEAF